MTQKVNAHRVHGLIRPVLVSTGDPEADRQRAAILSTVGAQAASNMLIVCDPHTEGEAHLALSSTGSAGTVIVAPAGIGSVAALALAALAVAPDQLVLLCPRESRAGLEGIADDVRAALDIVEAGAIASLLAGGALFGKAEAWLTILLRGAPGVLKACELAMRAARTQAATLHVHGPSLSGIGQDAYVFLERGGSVTVVPR